MATTFGARPEDTVADSRGNVLSGVVLSLYPTQTDATNQTSLIATVSTNSKGLWPYSDASSRSLLWVRDPNGNVWPTGSQEALGDVASKAPLDSPAFTGTPTGITKAHVGLGNVDNTSDANKPVSTAQQTALDARIQVTESPLMPEKYGAVGDGTTDDTAAFTAMAAVANGATGRPQIRLLEKSYRTTAPINITRAGWNVGGYSRFAGTRIVNAVSDVFTFGASSAGSKHYFHDLRITASAGHIFNVTNGTFSQNHLERLTLEQQSSSLSILNQTSGDHLDNLVSVCEFTGTTGHTVPLWKVLSSTGGINENTFQRGRSTYSGNYVFWLEETAAGQYTNSNIFQGWNFEIPNGGCIMGLSANGWTIESCNVYDLAGFNGGISTKDLYVLGKSTGPASRYNAFKRVIRHGGTLGTGLYDIKLQGGSSAPLTHLEQCDVSSGSGCKVDLGLNSAISLIDLGASVTVDNRGTQVYQNNGTGVGFFGKAPVAQAAAIASPTAPSATYVQAEAQAMKTAVDAIRTALTNIGITA